jgi:hypothetical protein
MKEIAPLLEKLAKQLGTTVEYLWGILVKQAMIASCIDIFQYIILGVATYFFVKITKKYWLIGEEKNWDNFWVIIPGLVGMALLIIWIAAFFCIQNTISGFLNPEYWALQKILGLIGSAK